MNQYTLKIYCYEDGASQEQTITAESIKDAEEQADEITQDWIEGGDWGYDGASVSTGWTLYDSEGTEVDGHDFAVEIEPDHEIKIKEATRYNDEICGTDPDDHEWTSEGEGGLRKNPGIWSGGGTTIIYDSHCRICGLHRSEVRLGCQKNPGEHDTTTYQMLDEEQIASHRRHGTMEEKYYTCTYCQSEIAESDAPENEVPRPSDRIRWSQLAKFHAPGCEWIELHEEEGEEGDPSR